WVPTTVIGILACAGMFAIPAGLTSDNRPLMLGGVVTFGVGMGTVYVLNALRRKHTSRAVYYYNNPGL
ncbi:MAG: hypothetical protein ACRC3B_22335, partial [Bacteroidia bacterium]